MTLEETIFYFGFTFAFGVWFGAFIGFGIADKENKQIKD